MKRKKLLLGALAITAAITGGMIFAADHIDSPNVKDTPSDITDVYVFRAENPDNLVFVGNTQGLMSPTASATAKFDENTLIEFNIDNNNDNIEDLVLQAKYDEASKKMVIYGPTAPSEKGTRSRLEGNVTTAVAVTPYGSAPVMATSASGIKVFAGPRDDPFFFDLDQFKKVVAGTATAFLAPGLAHDKFAGTNVMSVVLEVPKTLLGGSGKVNVWLETKKKI
jgi:hypothetical protein